MFNKKKPQQYRTEDPYARQVKSERRAASMEKWSGQLGKYLPTTYLLALVLWNSLEWLVCVVFCTNLVVVWIVGFIMDTFINGAIIIMLVNGLPISRSYMWIGVIATVNIFNCVFVVKPDTSTALGVMSTVGSFVLNFILYCVFTIVVNIIVSVMISKAYGINVQRRQERQENQWDQFEENMYKEMPPEAMSQPQLVNWSDYARYMKHMKTLKDTEEVPEEEKPEEVNQIVQWQDISQYMQAMKNNPNFKQVQNMEPEPVQEVYTEQQVEYWGAPAPRGNPNLQVYQGGRSSNGAMSFSIEDPQPQYQQQQQQQQVERPPSTTISSNPYASDSGNSQGSASGVLYEANQLCNINDRIRWKQKVEKTFKNMQYISLYPNGNYFVGANSESFANFLMVAVAEGNKIYAIPFAEDMRHCADFYSANTDVIWHMKFKELAEINVIDRGLSLAKKGMLVSQDEAEAVNN